MNQIPNYFAKPYRPLAQPAASQQNTQGTAGNMVDAFQAGALSAVGGIFDFVGAKGLASQFYGWADDQNNQISDAGRESMGKQIFDEDEQGNFKLGEGASDLDTWLLGFANVAGQFLPTAIPGAGAAGLATKALTLGKIGSKVATGVGMGLTGGSSATGQGMEQAREEIRNMPNKLKAESPIFQELIRGIHAQNPDATPQEKWKLATEALAEQVANEVRSDPKVLLANFGASAIGDPIIGRALVGARIAKSGAIRSAFKGFATEGTTEAAQAGVQQYGINEAIRPIDNRDLMQGVKSAAANEGIMGGAFGGVAGGLGGVVNRQTEKPLVDTEQAPSVEPTQTRQPDPATEAVKASNPILGDVLDQFDKSSSARADAINQAVNYDIPTVARQAGATTPVEVANLGRAYDDSPIQEALKKMQQGRSQTVQDMINKATQNKAPTPQDRFLPAKFEYQGEVLSQAPRQPQQRIDSGPIDGQLDIKPKALPQGQARIAQKDIVFAGNNSGVNVKTNGNVFLSPKEALISKNARAAKRAGNEIEAVPFGDGFGWRVTKAVTNEQSNRLDTGSIEQPSDRQVRSLGNTLPDSQREAGQSGLRDTNGQLSRSNGAGLPVSDGRNTNDNAVAQNKFEGLPIQEAPLNELTLSDDVPQFKDGANAEGVVTALGGSFDRTGVAPIQVWVREDGRKEVVTGRHRLDLARRSGEASIPAQYHYEEDGFNADNAAQLDAILNIRDNQGQVKDYVNYFQANKQLTEEKAKSEGLLRQALGRRAYSIATRASEDVIASHSAGIISDEAAERLANVAPNEDKYQTLGLKKLQEGKGIAYTENFIRAVKSMEGDQGGSETLDMFGQDDSASIEADKMVKVASRKQRELRERLAAIRGAAKNPKVAKAEGIDIKDPNSLNKRIDQLTAEAKSWDNWHTNQKLVSQIRSEIGAAPLEAKAEAIQEVETVETVVDENQDSLFGEPESETERASREKVDQSKKDEAESKRKAEINKIDADKNVDAFSLTGSDRISDVGAASGQDDMFGSNKKPDSMSDEARSALNNALGNQRKMIDKNPSKYIFDELEKIAPKFATLIANDRNIDPYEFSKKLSEAVGFVYLDGNDEIINSIANDTEAWKSAFKEYLLGNKNVSIPNAGKQSTETVDNGVDKVEEPNLANTDDVGGELSYNRRSWTGITSKDIDAATNDTEKLKMAQKEKVWKRPNYEELVTNGMDAHKAYFIKLVYDAIAAKPKYKSDKQLKIYVDAVGEIRDSIEGIVKSKEFSQLYLDAIQEVAQSTRSYMSMVAAGGKMKAIGDMILDKVLPKDDKGYRWGRSNPEGNEKAVLLGNFTSKIQFGSKQLRDSVEAVMGNGWPAKQEMWQKSYEIKERNNEFLVTKKGRGKILGTFNTKEAAEQFAKDDSKTERSVQFKEPKVSLNNIKRTGPDYREGKNVSTEEVMNEFGLRGINFGNWIKGDANAKERQLHINHIYDGLMDLSDLLNIPPKAIGLNGMLGVAVGAQGNGGKFAAHFVPGLNEINITRNSGAGSLAHEWGHALDHYFAVQAGLARVEDPFLSDYSGYSRSFPGDIRPEIVEAYRSLMKAMKSKEFIETPEEVEQGRKVYFERAERDLLKGIKAARNEIERTDKTYLAEFDKLANDVVNNPPGEYVAIGKTKDYADESVVKLYDLLVKARGRSADKNIFRYIESQKRSMNYAKSAEEYAKIHTPQTSVSTDFKKGAANLDGATKKPYWSTNLEMFARAFEMYVLDRLSDNGKRSDYMTAAWKRDNDRYLEHNKDAYPQDQEAVEINKAFDTLLGEIKTKEGDNGNVIMFNRSTPINGNPVSLGQAKTVTKDFIDYYTGLDDDMEITVTDKKPSEVFKNAKLEDGDDTAIKGGFDKDSNRLYIFSANHSNIEDVRKTLREELLVHKGLGVFKPEEIAKLINTINGTRNSLNPKIKAIWADIERNYGKAPELVQAEEFLGKVAQIKPSSLGKYWNQIVSTLTRLLRKVGLVRKGITFTEMQSVVAEIGDKLRQGKRTENDGFSTQEAADSGLAYNTKKSNFNNWFVDSKVVDDNGDPLVVYHGTSSDFNEFSKNKRGSSTGARDAKKGFYFTGSPKVASSYAESYSPYSSGITGLINKISNGRYEKANEWTLKKIFGRGAIESANVLPVYLSIKNPLTVDFKNKEYSEIEFNKIVEDALESGSDGVIINNSIDGGFNSEGDGLPVTIYVAFEPNQIKSSIGNNGDYSASSNDIRFNRDTRTAEEKIGQGAAVASDTITQKGKKVVNALKSSEFWNRAAEGMFDGLHGIKQAEQGVGITDPTKMGYTSARLATGLGDMLHAVFHKGALEWKDGVTSIKKDTKGLLEVIGMLPEGEGLNNWLAWMAAGRAEMLSKLGKENNLTKEDIATLKAKAKGNEALFEEVRKEYNKINSATLDLAQEAGLLSPEQRGAFDEEWYVPFFREQSIDNPELTDVIKQITAPHTTKTGIVGQSAQIKELIGGKGSTKDLLENIIQRQVSMIDAAVKNNAAREIADNLAGTEYMTRDDDASINDAINTIGVSRGDLAKNFQKVRVMENGKPVYYYVSDPALLRGLLQVHDVGSKALFNKMARSAKRFLTTGITLSPDFIIRNFIRDAAHAWMVNKDGAKLGTDTWKGLKASWEGDDSYWDLIASGAAFQGGYIHGADPEAAQQQIRRAMKMKGLDQKEIDGIMKTVVSTKDGLLKAFEKYRNASDKIENANRVATYEAALKAGKSNKQALFESKDLMDYSMKGNFASLGTFIDMLPFFNARLQGMYKLGRAAAADGDDQFLKVLSKDLAFKGMKVAAFSAALAALNGDDERYKELPEWDKDAHWHFFLGSGNEGHIRIPKPFELGIIFGTLPERLYNFGAGKQTGKDLGDSVIHSMVNTLSLNPIPQLAMPTLEIIMNRSFFTGSAIEGMADENREKADRYNMNTSDTARMIGQFSDAIGLSPKQVQHLITGYTGTMGGYVLSMSDFLARAMTGRTKADTAVADWPIIKTLYQGGREPRSTVYQERFYESLQKAQEAYGSYKAAIDENDPERARELFEKRAEELNDRLALNRIQRKTSEISKRMRAVDNNQSLTSKEKQKRLEDLTKLKNDLYEQAYTKLNLADW